VFVPALATAASIGSASAILAFGGHGSESAACRRGARASQQRARHGGDAASDWNAELWRHMIPPDYGWLFCSVTSPG
jgi:hypothetical protein